MVQELQIGGTRLGTPRILVFGAGGQLGQDIARRSDEFSIEVIARSRPQADVVDAATVGNCLLEFRPDLVVNAAAYTKVDRAESEAEEAFRVNSTGARTVAAACQEAGLPLIHISTDYVFDGTKTSAYDEEDAVSPICVYGASKAAGEEAVRTHCVHHLIIRTSWVYGAFGSNFLKTMLKLANERDEIRVVADQFGCPTCTTDIAEAILALAAPVAERQVSWGTYHFAGYGATSWYQFASEIVDIQAAATGRRPNIVPITTADYPTAARRPMNSELDSSRFAMTFNVRARPWQERVNETVDGLLA